MSTPLSDEERARAALVPTYLIWRVDQASAEDDPDSTPIAACLSAEYAELELAKRRASSRARFEKSGPSTVLHDLERRLFVVEVARALIEKHAAGERGALDLEP